MSPELAKKVASPSDIEKAIEEYLVDRIEAFRTARRQQNMRYIFLNPAVAVAVYEGKLEKEGQKLFRVHCPVHVQLMMMDSKGEESRRDGINPLVIGVLQTLGRQRFGLNIKDLMPTGFKDVTTEDDFQNSKIVYDLEFATSFTIRVDADDPDAEDLLAVGLNYFFQPDDGLADAADIVTLDQGGAA